MVPRNTIIFDLRERVWAATPHPPAPDADAAAAAAGRYRSRRLQAAGGSFESAVGLASLDADSSDEEARLIFFSFFFF